MNPRVCIDVGTDSDHAPDRRGNANPEAAPLTPQLDEKTDPREPAGPVVPDDADDETFVGGAGI